MPINLISFGLIILNIVTLCDLSLETLLPFSVDQAHSYLASFKFP